jgi:hypothetical protein
MRLKILLLLLWITAAMNAQSIITLGSGTSIEVQTGADFCADSIDGSGTISGTGTLCGNPATVGNIPCTSVFRFFNILLESHHILSHIACSKTTTILHTFKI